MRSRISMAKEIEQLQSNQWLADDDSGLCTHCSEEGCALTELKKENEELKKYIEEEDKQRQQDSVEILKLSKENENMKKLLKLKDNQSIMSIKKTRSKR